MFKGPINAEVNDLVIDSDGEIAYSRSVQHVSGATNEGEPFDATFRITDVYSQESRQVGDRAGAHLSAPRRPRW
jgi:ketosteroid isomerase-like protein